MAAIKRALLSVSDKNGIVEFAKELSALKALASDLLRLGVSELSAAVAAKTLQEICHEN